MLAINNDNYTQITSTQKVLYKELFRRDFYEFVKFFWDCCDPAPFIDGKLIQYYCEIYQYMVRHWVPYEEIKISVPLQTEDTDVIDVRQNKNNYNVNVPPRHSKSMIFSVMGPVFVWLTEPILGAAVCHTESLATEMNQKRQKLINSDKFKFFFSEITLEANSASMIKDTRGGQLFAINRNALLGRGVSIISNDDITNAETARLDQKEMESAWSYYTQTMPSRVNDPYKYLILNVMQRLSRGDITGRILQNPKLAETYTFIVLPAQFKKRTILVCPISGDLIIYEKDDYLWPERFGDYSGLKAQIGESTFNAQYMQDPSSSDATIVKEHMITEMNCTEVPGWDITNNCVDQMAVDSIYSSNDLPCKKTDKSDFLGCVLGYKVKKRLYIFDCIEERQNIIDSMNHIKRLDNQYPGIIQVIEDKAAGIELLDLMNEEVPGLQRFQPGLDGKEQRCEMSLPWLSSGSVVFVKTVFNKQTNQWELSKNLYNLKERLLAFPLVSFDDICDSLFMLILYLFADARYAVYGKSFNELNIFTNKPEIEYSTTFFNKIGDTWKVLDIGIDYGLESKLVVLKEEVFTASIEQGLKYLKQFSPDKNVFIDCSIVESLTGVFNDEVIIEKYNPDELELSVNNLSRAFSKKQILIDSHCKGLQSDIDNFKYSKKDIHKFRTTDDGYVACLRVAMRYYGGI